MKTFWLTFFLVCVLNSLVVSQSVEFNVVYPVDETFQSIQLLIADPDSFQIAMSTNKQDNLTHQATYTPNTLSLTDPIKYKYEVHQVSGEIESENFWRTLEPCRVLSTSDTLWKTKNEYFQQSENTLGLSELPILENTQPIAPFYFDDNQIMTLSFQISEEDLNGVIFNPNDKGEIYVKSNLTMVSLSSRNYYEEMKIRRAGGISLRSSPYSYQIKFDHEVDGISQKVTLKLKAYPMDYDDDGADIISEKASSDICRSVGAPINYVSFVRVIVNGVFQGLYGMLEKVDDYFVERRWPFMDSSNSVGTLYKTQQSHWFLLTNTTWQSGIRDFCLREEESSSSCCPCFEHDCDIDSDCDVFDDDDEICQTLSCCSCTWESNGSVDIETANCVSQSPFGDYVTLGDTVLNSPFEEIKQILNAKLYASSSLCSLAVMNSDGYSWNGKNYVCIIFFIVMLQNSWLLI